MNNLPCTAFRTFSKLRSWKLNLKTEQERFSCERLSLIYFKICSLLITRILTSDCVYHFLNRLIATYILCIYIYIVFWECNMLFHSPILEALLLLFSQMNHSGVARFYSPRNHRFNFWLHLQAKMLVHLILPENPQALSANWNMLMLTKPKHATSFESAHTYNLEMTK